MRKLDMTYTFYELDMYPGGLYGHDEQDRKEIEMPSWVCCLFTMLALGCPTSDSGQEVLKPSDLFSQAKHLSRNVLEDESIQTIQALLLMVIPSQYENLMKSLYLANTDLRGLGWIFLGDAIRLAQLLGLHRNDAALQYTDPIEREARRRLWWTLYEFERYSSRSAGLTIRFSSMANGCPSSIHDNDSDTALPSESFLTPGDYTPAGYIAASVSLAQISGHIFQAMYSVPPQGVTNSRGNRLSRRTIADLYGELIRWRHDVNPNLRINPSAQSEQMDPSVKRALSFLDLRFQFAIISVTRPILFRLVSATRDGSFNSLSTETQTFIKTYADACTQSARSSLLTLKFMLQHDLLNNVLWLDTFYILSTAMVLLLEYLRASSPTEGHRVNECISILRNLQPRGTGRNVLASLSELAVYLGLESLAPTEQNSALDLQFYELFSSTTPSQANTPGLPSPEISLAGFGGFAFPVGMGNVGDQMNGFNEFSWMDQIVRMAYEEFGPG